MKKKIGAESFILIPSIIMFIMSIVFMGIGVATKLYNNYVVNNGTKLIVKVESIYSSDEEIYVLFFNNQEELKLHFYNPDIEIGDTIEVYFIEDSNNLLYMDGINTLTYVFFSVGAFFFVVFIILTLVLIDQKNKSELKDIGFSKRCKVIKIHKNMAVSVGNINPTTITLMSPLKDLYKWTIYEPIDDIEINDSITVYIDERNEKRYFVDYKNFTKSIDN